MTNIEDLFHCVYGSNLEFYKLEESESGIPFVARTSRNNGVITRVKKIPNEKINPAHTISVSCGGSVMECFYQDEEYYSGRDLYYLKPKIKLNTQQMIFYASVISSNRYKFSYGRQVNKTLPYIKLPKLKDLPKEINFSENKKYEFFKKDDFTFKALNTPVKNVFLGDLFDPCNGIASSEVKRLDTKINDNFLPYIRPTKDQRYSIDAYVDKNYIQNKYIFPKNTLYVSTDGQGSHSYAYLSIFEFVPNSNVIVLIPKRSMTIIEKLFYAFSITKYRYKFSYGRKPKGERLSSILLPEFPNIDLQTLSKKYNNYII